MSAASSNFDAARRPPVALEFIMRNLIAILTGLHVLAHGIFGCCDHGQAAIGAKKSACVCHHTVGQHVKHAEHGHHADDHATTAGGCGTTDEESPASPPHRCIHANCHWLAADLDAHQHAFEFIGLAALDFTSTSPATARTAAEFWSDVAAGHFSAPPLRLHLALGVLLI